MRDFTNCAIGGRDIRAFHLAAYCHIPRIRDGRALLIIEFIKVISDHGRLISLTRKRNECGTYQA